MESRLLSSAVLIVLTAIFGWYGVAEFYRAFRTTDFATWTEQAVQGGLGIIASSLIADIALRLLV